MLSVDKSNFSHSETTVSCVSGGHRYTLRTFSALNKEPTHSVASSNFKVGIHEWQIVCYPGGETEDVQEYVSLFLGYKGPYLKCSATWKLRCLNQMSPDESRERLWAKGDRYNTFTKGRRWGWQKFLKRDVVVNAANGFLLNDTLIFESLIDVHIQTQTTATTSDEPNAPRSLLHPIPKSALHKDYLYLLKNEELADVVFQLDQGCTVLKAHSQVLAARSPVFAKAFSKPHRIKSTTDGAGKKVIEIPDISAHIFSEMLFFIYTDRLTWFSPDMFDQEKEVAAPRTPTRKKLKDVAGASKSNSRLPRRGKKRKLMTEMKDAEEATPDSTVKTTYNYEAVCALFEAADKYEVNRLRLFCEHILTTMLCKESIQHILCVADKHDALNLKRICLNYLAQNSDDLLGSDDLVDFDPAMMKELIALVLARKKNGPDLSTSFKETDDAKLKQLLNEQNVDLHQLRRAVAIRGISGTGDTEELVDRLREVTEERTQVAST